MRRAFVIAFIAAPLVEVAGFVLVGRALGLWPTLALTVLSAAVGLMLVRAQGISVLRRAMAALETGRPPVGELFEAMLLALAGVLLLIPGFVSDALGLLLLIPPARAGLLRLVARGMAVRREAADDVIEGEWVEIVDPLPPPRRD